MFLSALLNLAQVCRWSAQAVPQACRRSQVGSAVTLEATPAAPAGSLLLTSGYVTVMCVRPCSEWAPCWASQHNTHETQSLPLRRSPEGGGDRPSGSSAEWEGSQDAAAPGEGLPPQLSCRRQQKVAECRDGGEGRRNLPCVAWKRCGVAQG